MGLLNNRIIIDVRSPGEFRHAHIPGAHNIPLFDDEERKLVGTTYKQVGRQDAIKEGLDFFGPKMRKMVEAVEQIKATNPTAEEEIFIHCWRGGMRSGAVAWLLDIYGFKIATLVGGYKAFRNWVLDTFKQAYKFRVVGGYTGSGKTVILEQIKGKGHPVIDLEDLAQHKGSVYGGFGKVQPSSELFENKLALELFKIQSTSQSPIWIEDESPKIGAVNVPWTIWQQMRESPLWFLDIPFDERLNYICKEYGQIPVDSLIESSLRIKKRLGGSVLNSVIEFLTQGNIKDAFALLLKYYDKQYGKGVNLRTPIPRDVQVVALPDLDFKRNVEIVLKAAENTLA